MSKPIDCIELNSNYRCFEAGRKFTFPNMVTIITGDNGSGKSTLVGLIRSLFNKTKFSMSELSCDNEILANSPFDESCNYIDLATDLLKNRGDIDYDNFTLHAQCMRQSSGQSSLAQLITFTSKNTDRIVIIDEPERGLSVGRQVLVGKYLCHFVENNPSVQVILVTHSREIVNELAHLAPLHSLPDWNQIEPDKYFEHCSALGCKIWEQYLPTLDDASMGDE